MNIKEREPYKPTPEDDSFARLKLKKQADKTKETSTAAAPVPETTLSQCALGMTDCPGMEEIDGKKACFFRKPGSGVKAAIETADECETAAAINVQL